MRESGQVCRGDEGSTRKLGKKIVDSSHMQRRNKLFQFGEKDYNEPGEGRFQLCPLTDLIGPVTSE